MALMQNIKDAVTRTMRAGAGKVTNRMTPKMFDGRGDNLEKGSPDRPENKGGGQARNSDNNRGDRGNQRDRDQRQGRNNPNEARGSNERAKAMKGNDNAKGPHEGGGRAGQEGGFKRGPRGTRFR